MEHLSAFFKCFAAQTTKLYYFEILGELFSDEVQEEMVLFFTIDFHATIALGNVSVVPANRHTLYFGKWFEPRDISYWFVVIFWVRIAFRKTVVGD